MEESPKAAQAGRSQAALALAALTLGLITLPLGFNLGAYDEVFYEDVLKVVWAAVILFFVTFVSQRPRHKMLTRLALASLPAWFVTAGVVVGSTGEALDRPLFAWWLAVGLLCSVPLTLKMMVDLFTPEVRSLRDRGLVFLVAVVVVVGLGSFAMGRHHPRFLTCSDFAVAGASEPEGCVK